MLAIDGMDWSLLQQLAERGMLPMLSSLIDAGACGRLDFPLPSCADSGWASVASGTLPDRHGLLHPLELLPDSLFAQRAGAGALRTPAAWHWADAAGRSAAVVGWPGTRALQLRHGQTFAPGVEMAPDGDGRAWPLAPDAVHPPELRELVHELRMAPEDLGARDIGFLLGDFADATKNLLAPAMAAALAQCVTLHAIGTAMLEQRDARLLMLRLALPAAVAALLEGQQDAAAVQLSMTRCYHFLDLVCGRYFKLAGPSALCAVMSNGTPANGGFIIMAGPGIARDRTIGPVNACDVLPTLAAAAGLPLPAGLDGSVVDEAFTSRPEIVTAPGATLPPPIRQGEIALTPDAAPIDPALFEGEGLELPDFGPQLAFARSIECETRLALANMALQRGRRDDGIAQMRALSERFPDALPVRIALAEQLLLAGQSTACEALVREFPLVQQGGAWADAVYGVLALSRGDWQQASRRLTALTHLAKPPVNPHLWLGRMHEMQSSWSQAVASFAAATAHCPQDAEAWSGLGRAALACGQFADAARAYGRAVSLQPRSAQALNGLASAWDHCGQTDKAAHARARAMIANPAWVARSTA